VNGRPARLHNEYYRIGEVMTWAEREYGLQGVARAGRTADARPCRAEQEKARRTGRHEPPRVTLRRHAAGAAAGARSEADFFSGLEARGLVVRLRRSTVRPGEVTGYAVGLPGDHTARGGQVWYGGGKLAADLTLPKLRRRWSSGPWRLSGHGMGGPAARAALRREVARCAAVASSEPEFWAGLHAAGLLVMKRPDPAWAASPAGYAVSLPGLQDRAGQPVWFGGGTLSAQLQLGELQARWRAGQPGAASPGLFDGADATEIYAHAATVAACAARELQTARGGRADIAWATADILTAAADATGNPTLRQAADGFARAGRALWGRVPALSPDGQMLRTAAYLLAATRPQQRSGESLYALVTALIKLTRAVARLRAAQQRQRQAAAALQTAAVLATSAPAPDAHPPARAPRRTLGRPPVHRTRPGR
jgi:hypothetical protein